MDEVDVMFWVGFVGGIMISSILIWGIFFPSPAIEKLGQSICEEEHHMDFKSYDDGVLECKPAPEEKKYDGIKVRIVGGTNG